MTAPLLLAGGDPLLGSPGGRSREATWAEVLALDPEVVVVAPCGVPPDQAWEQAADLPEALVRRELVVMDLARPGPRLVDAVEGLAAFLHPEAGVPQRPDVVGRPPSRDPTSP